MKNFIITLPVYYRWHVEKLTQLKFESRGLKIDLTLTRESLISIVLIKRHVLYKYAYTYLHVS